jgi:excisionase family DNA binding protein
MLDVIREDVVATGGERPFPREHPDKEVLQTADVANILALDVQVVRRFVREGRLPAYRIPGGRKYYFFRNEIFDWLRSHAVVPTEQNEEETAD